MYMHMYKAFNSPIITNPPQPDHNKNKQTNKQAMIPKHLTRNSMIIIAQLFL
jgi:hypothetical protein